MPKGKAKTPGAIAWEKWNTTILNNMWLPHVLDRVLLKLKKKKLEPLIQTEEDAATAEKLKTHIRRITTKELPKAKETYVPKPADWNTMQAHQHEVHNSLILFHLAVMNFVTEDAIRAVVPDKIYPNNSDAYGKIRLWMLSIGRQSQNQTCAWLLEEVNLIINSVESYAGPSWSCTLVSEERCEIWTAVWDQHQLFTLMKFRKRESGAVYFPHLFSRINCPGRKKFRTFFRTMFIEMAEMTYVFRVCPLLHKLTRDNKHCKKIVFRLWKSFPQQERTIKACGLLKPYDLPGVPSKTS